MLEPSGFLKRTAININNCKRRYLSRRITYASNGSFNPCIITNKEAHITNGNPSKDSAGANLSLSKTESYRRCPAKSDSIIMHANDHANEIYFMNYCLDFPGKFSCAIVLWKSAPRFFRLLSIVQNVTNFSK